MRLSDKLIDWFTDGESKLNGLNFLVRVVRISTAVEE